MARFRLQLLALGIAITVSECPARDVLAQVTPTITAIGQNFAASGETPVITITGSNLVQSGFTTQVFYQPPGVAPPVPFTDVSGDAFALTAVFPAGQGDGAGTVYVVVQPASGPGQPSSAEYFSIGAAVGPMVDGIFPDSAAVGAIAAIFDLHGTNLNYPSSAGDMMCVVAPGLAPRCAEIDAPGAGGYYRGSLLARELMASARLQVFVRRSGFNSRMLPFQVGFSTPTLERSWGSLKSAYR